MTLISCLALVACNGDDSDAGRSSASATATITSTPTTARGSTPATSNPGASTSVATDSAAGSSTPPATTAAATDSVELDALLFDAVYTTLDARSFDVELSHDLEIGPNELHFTASGSVDYPNMIVDSTIGVDGGGQDQLIVQVADGERVWARVSGTFIPDLPAGTPWIEIDPARILNNETFQPSGLIGSILLLTAAEEVTQVGQDEIDGVPTRHYRTTVTYVDALAAADEQADELTRSFSLSGTAMFADVHLDVWIGPDGFIRRMVGDIDDDDELVDGELSVRLRNINAPVAKPDTPPDDQVATGPEADRLIDLLLGESVEV